MILKFVLSILIYFGLDVWHDWDQIRDKQGRSRGNHWKAADAFKHGLYVSVAAAFFISTELFVLISALTFGAALRHLTFDLGLNAARGLPLDHAGEVGLLDRIGKKLGPFFIPVKILIVLVSGYLLYIAMKLEGVL